jgi:hypothetical protein
MPTKNAEKIVQAAVYIDGKPIKGIQEIRPQKITVKRSFIYRLAKMIRIEIFVFMFKLRRRRKER